VSDLLATVLEAMVDYLRMITSSGVVLPHLKQSSVK
jgi:hypothetical protein